MLRPAYKLILGDRKVDTTEDAQTSTVVQLRVELSMETPSDRAVIVLGNADGLRPEQTDDASIELGYEGDTTLTKVLTGAVDSVDNSLTQRRVIAHTAQATLLRTFVDRTFEGKKAGEIVSDLADGAGVETARVSQGTLYPAYVIDGQRSVYHHMRDLAALNGYDVYITPDGELVFEPFGGTHTVHVLDYGKHVVELEVHRGEPSFESIALRGESPGAAQGDDRWAWLSKEADGSSARSGDGDPQLILERSAVRTAEGAHAAADAALSDATRRAVRGRVVTFGSPQIKLGDAVQIRDTPDTRLSRVYQVRGVTHCLDKRRGFASEVAFRGLD